jgi:SAM-dependent methyltransferase
VLAVGGAQPAYEGVDDLGSFAGPAAVAAYRRQLREGTAHQSEFIAARLGGDGGSVLEVACGNGRLLIDLALRDVIGGGHGIDLAASRIGFATAWAREEGLDNLTFEAGDALQAELPRETCSLALCITGALAYFEPLGPGLADAIVARLTGALEPGGLVVVELYPHPEYRRVLEVAGGHARLWQELPPEDPWRYYLSELTLDGETLTHRKTFIHRSDGEVDEGREERLTLYDAASAAALLTAAGLTDIGAFEGWSDQPYSGGETLVITARTPS